MEKFIYYIGNGAYCYANSTSMLLASIGENISPSVIEVLTGVGIGITLEKENNLLYFNNQMLLPDLGLTKALEILGFNYKTKFFQNIDDFPVNKLKSDLKTSPAVLGPLDMGYLVYNPHCKYLKEVDHFVLVYKADNKGVYLHDPAGFPYVFLQFKFLKEAWQAKGISYRKGFYRYTFSVKRKEKPKEKEIYNQALNFFRLIYKEGSEKTDRKEYEVGSEAVYQYVKYVRQSGLNEKERNHFVYFALPLAAKRAMDYAKFFEPYNAQLSKLKYQQSETFGIAHAFAMNRDWGMLADYFEHLAKLEEKFRLTLLKS